MIWWWHEFQITILNPKETLSVSFSSFVFILQFLLVIVEIQRAHNYPN